MQVSPRYGHDPVLVLDGVIDDPSVPLLRQRHRLAAQLASLTDTQWAAPSRCEGWSVQDVARHLVTTNQFWALSIRSGLGGQPTEFLAGFDPVATPAQLVDAARADTPAETLAHVQASNQDLAAAVEGLDPAGWSRLAEAPPGHLAIRLLALHALWDAWIHERDVVVRLGLDEVLEPDEIIGSLGYVAALGPTFLATQGSTRVGTLEVRATDPDCCLVIELGSTVVLRDGPAPPGTAVLAGDAVELVEALSFRAPLADQLAGLDASDRWVLGGLGPVFDQPG